MSSVFGQTKKLWGGVLGSENRKSRASLGSCLLMLSLLTLVPKAAVAGSIMDFVSALKRGQVNLETLVALQTLDKSSDAIGYGLCMASERQDCSKTGSLGYGLCMAAGRKGCDEGGSLGYGLCMAGNRSNCPTQAGLGYGLCMAANRGGCAEDI